MSVEKVGKDKSVRRMSVLVFSHILFQLTAFPQLNNPISAL